ncbi:uncharacterized protein LOC131649366 [Vicia villosa]|uniref:uncharacterized protein LOC131649366 n=1 Tax=Vicia villosa TaxID=3911 RepID=UPI00273C9122|nr:uncharacterized protein LOC131649366 [Vicia villosa]
MAEENHVEPPCESSPRRFAHLTNNPAARRAEMKTGMLQIMYANPFSRLDHEDPYTHLTKFYEIAGTLGTPAAEEEVVFMRLFPHSLIGKAKEWYHDQSTETMTNWNVLEKKILSRFFSHNRFMDAKTAIATYTQAANETLCEAWERYKSMLRKCPNHGFDNLSQIHIFRNGLLPQPKLLLDATAGGSLLAKSAEEAAAIINKMALTDHQVQHNRGNVQKKAGILELGTNDAILAQNKLLTQTVEELTKQLSKLPQQLKEMHGSSSTSQQVAVCELCTGDHQTGFFPPLNEEVNYLGNQQQRQTPYQNNQGYPYNNNTSYGQNRSNQYQSYTHSDKLSKIEDTLNQFMQLSMANQKNTDALIRNLETQVGQIAKQLSDQQRGTFTASTQTNPKENCNSITTIKVEVVENKVGESEKEKMVVMENQEENNEKKDEAKATDPGQVNLPVTIGNIYFNNALVDLGSSVNLLPLSTMRKIEDLHLSPTTMKLQLADKSTTKPIGVMKDVMIKLESFQCSTGFVVISMNGNEDGPPILGRPFIKLARMMIDVDERKMKVRHKDGEINFTLFQHKEDDYSKDKAPDELGLEALKEMDKKERPKYGGKDILTNSYKPP